MQRMIADTTGEAQRVQYGELRRSWGAEVCRSWQVWRVRVV